MDFAAHLSQSVSKVEADTTIAKYQGHAAAPAMNGERLQARLALAEARRRAARPHREKEMEVDGG